MRLLNRLLAALVALALIAVAVIVPVEVIRAALGKTYWVVPWPAWTRTLAATSWHVGWVRAILVGVGLLGLLLLLAQLKPRRPGVLPLAPLGEHVEAGTTRRSLQHVVRRAATEVDGVSSATARAGRRRVTVTARSRLRDPAGLEERVRERVAGRLADLQLARTPRVAVRVRGAAR